MSDDQQSTPLARVLSIIDGLLAEAKREELAHHELQRRSDYAASLPVSEAQLDAAATAAAANSDWSSMRRARRQGIGKLAGELFPSFDEFPLGDELLKWGTAHGMPPDKLVAFRDGAKMLINALAGWRTSVPQPNPNCFHPDDDPQLCNMVTAVRAIHAEARDLQSLAKPVDSLTRSDIPKIVHAINDVIHAFESPRQWAGANRPKFKEDISFAFKDDAFKELNDPAKAAEQWWLATVSRTTVPAVVALFAPFDSENTVNPDARITHSTLDMETKARLVEVWHYFVNRHCAEHDVWEAQKTIRYLKGLVRELNGTAAEQAKMAGGTTDMIGLLVAIRRLRTALENPALEATGMTICPLSEAEADSINAAFVAALEEKNADGLPLGVETKLRSLLPVWNLLRYAPSIDEPNGQRRRNLNSVREIEAALVAFATPRRHDAEQAEGNGTGESGATPPSVYRLLEFIKSKSSRTIRHSEVPAELRDALTIAYARQFVDCSTDDFQERNLKGRTLEQRFGSPQAAIAAQLAANFADPYYQLTSAGLLALATHREAQRKAEGSDASERTNNGTNESKGKRIDERMAKLLLQDPECVKWSARQWAEKLECSPSTVHGTTTWRKITGARAIAETDRTERDRERRPPDRRRFRRNRSGD